MTTKTKDDVLNLIFQYVSGDDVWVIDAGDWGPEHYMWPDTGYSGCDCDVCTVFCADDDESEDHVRHGCIESLAHHLRKAFAKKLTAAGARLTLDDVRGVVARVPYELRYELMEVKRTRAAT